MIDRIRDISLAPKSLNDFVGCKDTKLIVQIAINAAKNSGLATLGNILMIGQRGMGKTTLAQLICTELNRPFKLISGKSVTCVADLNSLLLGITKDSFLIIDEIHGLKNDLSDLLHQALDSFSYSYSTSDHKSITVKIERFFLIAATTAEGRVSAPLLSRFRKKLYLEPYSPENIQSIVLNCANNNGIQIDSRSAYEIAVRSNGVPRIALHNFLNVHEFAIYKGHKIDIKLVEEALNVHGIDAFGLNRQQRLIITKLNKNPVGLQQLESETGISKESIEETYEPYLLQIGFINRTPRGRILTQLGINYRNKMKI